MQMLSSLQDDSRAALARALHCAALRQTATLRAACAAVTHAPTLDDCAAAVDRMREELDHLEDSADLYRELFEAELTEQIAQASAQLPQPTSWLDASVAQLVLCLASQLEASHRLKTTRSVDRQQLRRLAQESEHVDAARAALAGLRTPMHADAIQAAFARWLPLAFATLEEDVHPAYREALRRDVAALGVELEARTLAVS